MWPSKQEEWEYLVREVECLQRSLASLQEGLEQLRSIVTSLGDFRYSTTSSQSCRTTEVVRGRRPR